MNKSWIVAALALAGCSGTHATPKHPSLDDIAREYLRLAVALGERDPDALDYYYGPSDWVAGVRASPPALKQIANSATGALTTLSSFAPAGDMEKTRQRFLAGQLHAIVVRTSLLLGVHHTFDEESEAFFGIRPAPVDSAAAGPVLRRIARRLRGNKRLADRFNDFDTKFTIPPTRLPDVMARALEACREQTVAHMRLPPGERVSLEYVTDKPWSAYSFYHGNYQSVIQVNADFGLTIDRALRLACHEGYPGHHVFNSLTEEGMVRAAKRIEFFAQPTFSPQSFISEAAASIAPEVAFSAVEKLRVEKDKLFPVAGLGNDSKLIESYLETEDLVDSLHLEELAIARDYLDENLEFVRAASALEDRTLMVRPEATLRYLNEYRTYVVTYTAGRDLLTKWMDARVASGGNSGGRWDALRDLIAAPERFQPAIN